MIPFYPRHLYYFERFALTATFLIFLLMMHTHSRACFICTCRQTQIVSKIERKSDTYCSCQMRRYSLENFDCRMLAGHKDVVMCVDVNRAGDFAASCSKDHSARVWQLHSLRCVAMCEGHTEAVGAVAFAKLSNAFIITVRTYNQITLAHALKTHAVLCGAFHAVLFVYWCCARCSLLVSLCREAKTKPSRCGTWPAWTCRRPPRLTAHSRQFRCVQSSPSARTTRTSTASRSRPTIRQVQIEII